MLTQTQMPNTVDLYAISTTLATLITLVAVALVEHSKPVARSNGYRVSTHLNHAFE